MGGERGGEENERRCAVDLKTVCRTGTGGLCNVPPSLPFNRAWLRNPFDFPVLPFPDIIAHHVVSMRAQFTKTKRKRGGKGGAAGKAGAAGGGAGAAGAAGHADDSDVIVVDSD